MFVNGYIPLLCLLSVALPALSSALPTVSYSSAAEEHKRNPYLRQNELPRSNSERMARGLAPAPPKRLYSGSRTNSAHVSKRSAPAGDSVFIQASYVSSASSLGYFAVDSASGGFGVIVADVADADTYVEPTTLPATNVDLELEYSSDYGQYTPQFPYLCVGDTNGGDVGSSDGVFTFSACVNDNSGVSFDLEEVPGPVTVTYTNDDDTVATPNLYYDSSTGIVYASASAADVNEYEDTNLSEDDAIVLDTLYLTSPASG